MSKIENLLREYPSVIAQISELHQRFIEKVAEKQRQENPLKAIAPNDMPRGKGQSDPTFELAQKIVDGIIAEIQDISEKLQVLYAKRNYIEALVKQLEPIEYRIINLRYFQNMYLWQVGQALHYSKSEAYRMNQKILERLEHMEQIR